MLLGATWSCLAAEAAPSPAPLPTARTFTLAFTADLAGEVEPCGCAVEPLGGLARQATVLRRLRAERENVLYVDVGDLEGHAPRRQTAVLRAVLADLGLGARLADKRDLAELIEQAAAHRRGDKGTPRGTLPLVLTNVRPTSLLSGPVPAPAVEPTRLVSLGSGPLAHDVPLRVGILGVREPDHATAAALRRLGLAFTPAAEAATAAAADLRARGADLVLALLAVGRLPATRAFLEATPGIDVAVASGVDTRLDPAETVGPNKTLLVSPLPGGKELGRVDVTLRAPGTRLWDARARERLAALLADHERQANATDEADTDAARVHRRAALAAAVVRDRAALAAAGPPPGANTYDESLIALDATWPDAPDVAAALRRLKRHGPLPAPSGL